jgi:hypothetical protein
VVPPRRRKNLRQIPQHARRVGFGRADPILGFLSLSPSQPLSRTDAHLVWLGSSGAKRRRRRCPGHPTGMRRPRRVEGGVAPERIRHVVGPGASDSDAAVADGGAEGVRSRQYEASALSTAASSRSNQRALAATLTFSLCCAAYCDGDRRRPLCRPAVALAGHEPVVLERSRPARQSARGPPLGLAVTVPPSSDSPARVPRAPPSAASSS